MKKIYLIISMILIIPTLSGCTIISIIIDSIPKDYSDEYELLAQVYEDYLKVDDHLTLNYKLDLKRKQAAKGYEFDNGIVKMVYSDLFSSINAPRYDIYIDMRESLYLDYYEAYVGILDKDRNTIGYEYKEQYSATNVTTNVAEIEYDKLHLFAVSQGYESFEPEILECQGWHEHLTYNLSFELMLNIYFSYKMEVTLKYEDKKHKNLKSITIELGNTSYVYTEFNQISLSLPTEDMLIEETL